MVTVGPGRLRPMYPAAPTEQEVAVPAFRLDRVPVTSARFLAFLKAHPEWRRDRAPRLFVDERYLRDWQGPMRLGPAVDPESPVTQVSWFAALSYCKARGARLPTEQEWELAAAADETQPDARRDPAQQARILGWYGQPTPARLPPVGRAAPNLWGAKDLHGLVWEWVLDFNSTMVTGDSRERSGADRMLFCGAGALAASDRGDYASFMRYAFRGSLGARDTTRNLGFRCAADLPPKEMIP